MTRFNIQYVSILGYNMLRMSLCFALNSLRTRLHVNCLMQKRFVLMINQTYD